MSTIKNELATIEAHDLQTLKNAETLDQLETARIDILGRKGKLSRLVKSLANEPIEKKRELGPLLNSCKQLCQQAYDERKSFLEDRKQEKQQANAALFDTTLYIPHQLHGSLHPLTHIQTEITHIFLSMGYDIVDGPEIENEFYNFEALNIPSDHPARDMFDTFWLDIQGLLLRTHTSNVQARTMNSQQPPIAAVAPGRCYRHEATDATHDFQFMQLEGVFVDQDVSLSQLLATVEQFLKTFFGKELATRVRPSYFPFVEPGIEIDVQCPFCQKGCSICKLTQWIEMCGAGLIHPRVLQACGIDHKKYTGFAFGFGLTRAAMLKYGINDIRLLHANDVSFLKQF